MAILLFRALQTSARQWLKRPSLPPQFNISLYLQSFSAQTNSTTIGPYPALTLNLCLISDFIGP